MFLRKLIKLAAILGIYQLSFAYADEASDFEFRDYQCTGDESGQRNFTSKRMADSQVVEVNSSMNCAFSAQAPEYEIGNKEIVFKYKTMAMEKGAFATCECSHRITFKLKIDDGFSVRVYEDGTELPVNSGGAY